MRLSRPRWSACCSKCLPDKTRSLGWYFEALQQVRPRYRRARYIAPRLMAGYKQHRDVIRTEDIVHHQSLKIRLAHRKRKCPTLALPRLHGQCYAAEAAAWN